MKHPTSSSDAASSSAPVYIQSAALPFKFKNGILQLLLITNRKGKRWVIPKGLVEDDLTALESAVREAWEEAGIEGRISRKSVGEFRYRKWGGTCIVEVFLFKVTEVMKEWPEDDFRQREWVGVEEAAGRGREKELRKIIRQAPELIEKANIG